MRDTRKNQEYFVSFLDYQYSRIESKYAKLHECNDNEKRQRILLSMTSYEIDLLKAEFSSGTNQSDLKILLIRAIDIVKEYKKITKEDLITLLSLSIMLNEKNDIKKLIAENNEIISNDRLLKCLSEYIISGKIIWDSKAKIDKEYALLDDVFTNNDKEEAMKTYLSNWYNNHKSCAWFDNHLSDSDTYCGYWSFESGALTLMLSLNVSAIKDCEFFPII